MTEELAPPAPLPLAHLHHRLGAHVSAQDGRERIEHYGDPRAEALALTMAAGLLDRSAVDRLELVGRDRQRFLHGLVSCDIQGLTPGQGTYGFFTSPQGKILADVEVLALDDRLWLDLPAGKAAFIAGHLKKYIIADKVEVLSLSDRRVISLLGPGAEAVLGEVNDLPSTRLAHRAATVLGIEVQLVRCERAGLPGFDLWVAEGQAEALVTGLLARPGVSPVGRLAFEQARVEAGVPAFGEDFGEEHFPQESGLEQQAVSYTKGCYLGQEIVARIHYRGKANHRLTRLRFAGPLPARGTRLLFEGQEVGRVGSAVFPLSGGDAIGLAVVHRKGGELGTRLEVEGFGSAEVISAATE